MSIQRLPWASRHILTAQIMWQGPEMEMQSDAWVVLSIKVDVLTLEGAMFHHRSVRSEDSSFPPLTKMLSRAITDQALHSSRA